MKKHIVWAVAVLVLLSGCSVLKSVWTGDVSDEGENLQAASLPVSEEKADEEKDVRPGVNPYLWQASLDSLAFMPLASTDAQGGVIVTEWKAMSHNEQFKVVVNIYTQDLRADSVKAEVYRRVLKNGLWIDDEADGHLSDELEKNILIRAKQLYYNDVAAR